jgi:hypothetical protein
VGRGSEEGYVGGSCNVGCVLGGRDISMKGAPNLLALFKKRSEIKLKKELFST